MEQVGKLNLVDLAGSEKVWKSGSQGDTLEEAKKINWSAPIGEGAVGRQVSEYGAPVCNGSASGHHFSTFPTQSG